MKAYRAGDPPADPNEPRSAGDHRVAHAHEHPHPHEHPHAADLPHPGGLPRIGFVGAGAVGTALGVAFARAGWPVVAVASRDAGRRERFARLVGGAAAEAAGAGAEAGAGAAGAGSTAGAARPGIAIVPRAVADPAALLDEVDLLFLTVPDDAIAAVAAHLRLYGGQAIVHTSGLLGPEPLAPALAAGSHAGSFHPLVAFAETGQAVAALRGATVALEGDERLTGLLAELADAIGATPVRLAPGAKAAYHAAAVLAAGGLVALLDAIAELGRVAGLDEPAALAIYAPLLRGTLANAESLGIRAALTGPATRGDAGTLAAHLDELARRAPGVLPLYAAAADREIDLAEARGAIDGTTAGRLRATVVRSLAEDR